MSQRSELGAGSASQSTLQRSQPPLRQTKVFKLLKDAVPRTEGMLMLDRAALLRGVGQLSGMCDAAGECQMFG